MVDERRSHSVLFRGMVKSPILEWVKKCWGRLLALEKRVLRIEKEMFPSTGKGGKDGKNINDNK